MFVAVYRSGSKIRATTEAWSNPASAGPHHAAI